MLTILKDVVYLFCTYRSFYFECLPLNPSPNFVKGMDIQYMGEIPQVKVL